MDSSIQKERIQNDNKYEDIEEDHLVKLQKVQEYLSPQLSENKDIINQCLIENTYKKQKKQPSNSWNQPSNKNDLQQTRPSSKNFHRESEYIVHAEQYEEHSNNQDKRKNKRNYQEIYENRERRTEAKELTIDALTTCIYSSITKNKIYEMKIQELENIIAHLQQVNMQSIDFSHSTGLDNNSPNKVYSSSYYQQQFTNSHSSNIRKSPCRKHSISQSKSPDLQQSINKQNMNKYPQQGYNEYIPIKNFYQSKSSEFIKDSENLQNQNGNINYKQQNQNKYIQYNGSIQIAPSSNSVQGIRNDQINIQSPTKSKSSVQFQNMESVNSGNNIIQMEYLSKVKFLEEAIDYKNKEIERLMVLTAASRRNNHVSVVNSKSPERVKSDIDTNEINNLTQEEDIKSNQLKMHMIISDLERKNADLENELFNCKCEIEEKDKDILKIRQQIDELQNCAYNQINCLQINEDLELRLKEKELEELNMLAQLEQQKLIIENVEIDQIKKLEDYKDIISKIQNQNVLDLQSMQSEKDDMQQHINNLQDVIATLEHKNSKRDEEKIKKALNKNKDENGLNSEQQEQQRKSEELEKEIIHLKEEINLQQQIIDKQKQDLERSVKQKNNTNRKNSQTQSNVDQGMGENKLQEQPSESNSQHQLSIEKQNSLNEIAKLKEDLVRQKEELIMKYNKLNDEREAFTNEKQSFEVSSNMLENERDQLDQERKQVQQNHNLLQRELQQLERDRSQLDSDIQSFERNNQQFESKCLKSEKDRLQFQRESDQLESDQQQFEREKQLFQNEVQQFEQDIKQKQRNNLQFERNSQQFEKDCLAFQKEKKEFEKQKKEFDHDQYKLKKDKSEAANQQNSDIIGLQQIIEEKEELIAYMKQQQLDNLEKNKKLKQQVQVQIRSYEDVIEQNQLQNQDLIKVNEQLIEENQQLIEERDAFIQERNQNVREDAEILELKKQLMHEGIAKQELQQRVNEVIKNKKINEDLMKENCDLKNTLEQLKGKIKGMQNIDDDIKDYINNMCKEKNNLQDRHVAHLEEIKNLKLQLKATTLENKSLNLNITTLKEEINLYQNQQTDMMLDEKNKKSFLKVQLQKKLNLLNSQLETYIRSTLDLDEIYYILLFSKQNNSPFSSPKKTSINQQFQQSQQGINNSMSQQNRKSYDQALNTSTQSVNFQKNIDQSIEIDEKTQQKIEQLNNKRKKDLDKVYQIMEGFISLVSQIQQ